MSDEAPPPNPFSALFGTPLTPEQRLEKTKRSLAKRKAVLVHVREARLAMREIDRLGFSDQDRHIRKIAKNLAVLEDKLEADLAWPVEV